MACGSAGGASLTIAGGSSSFPLAEYFAGIYKDACQDLNITISADILDNVAHRICGDTTVGTPVDIGATSLEFTSDVATKTSDGYHYDCVVGDTARSVLPVEVAFDALALIVQKGDGSAINCIRALGGLTPDQVRWIFSRYTMDQLLATGWSATAVPNSDGLDDTHLWSELSSSCDAVEIAIGGPDPNSYAGDFFSRAILADYKNGEELGSTRPSGYTYAAADDYPVTWIANFPGGLSFIGLDIYSALSNPLVEIVQVQGPAGFAAPTVTAIQSREYVPLSRILYWNVLTTRVADAKPLVQAALRAAASVTHLGYLPISSSQLSTQIDHLGMAESSSGAIPIPASRESKNVGGIVSGVLGSLIILVVLFVVARKQVRKRPQEDAYSYLPYDDDDERQIEIM